MGLEVGFPGERIIVIPAPMLDLMADHPLTSDLYICSLGHLTHARYHAVDRPKGSSSYVFIYCVWGKGEVVISGHSFVLHPNQAVIVPKGVPVRYGASEEDPWSIYWIKFNGGKGQVYARLLSEPLSVRPSIYLRIEQQIELFERMFTVLCGEKTTERLIYANQILPYFLSSYCFAGRDFVPEESPTHAAGVINSVIQYMNDNLERKLTISELAQYARFSKSYFYRMFMREKGISPLSYFMQLKINKAAILLLKTSMSISQIAAKLSFGSAEYFSRSFRKVIGLSPQEFRKQDFKI